MFKSVVASGKNYTNSEKTAIEIRTPDEFTKFWKRTNSAKDAFDKRHESGLGLVSKTYQNSAAAAGEFMHEFAPIINIVKDFAAPYGGMAIGILSTLFMVSISCQIPPPRVLIAQLGCNAEERYRATLRIYSIRH